MGSGECKKLIFWISTPHSSWIIKDFRGDKNSTAVSFSFLVKDINFTMYEQKLLADNNTSQSTMVNNASSSTKIIFRRKRFASWVNRKFRVKNRWLLARGFHTEHKLHLCKTRFDVVTLQLLWSTSNLKVSLML